MKIHTICVAALCGMLVSRSTQLDIETCKSALGMEDKRIPDSALSASSSHDETSVGPKSSRLNSDSSGGAWCPLKPISRDSDNVEYLEIDLNSMHVITQILTQGRFGNGRGQEYAESYKVQYWRPGMANFNEYADIHGRKIFPGNTNTYGVSNNSLSPPIFASKFRILPYSIHQRTVCMRLEIVGCEFQEGVVSYSIPRGMQRGSTLELMDHTFDGLEDSQTGDLRGGLGQLVDGKYGWDNFKAPSPGGQIKGYDWLGWKKRMNTETINLVFTFDTVRTFYRVDIHTNNHFSKDIQIFRRAKIYFSNEEDKFGDDRSVDFKYMPDLAIENARNVSINLKEEHGQFVMIQLYFAAKWILISEVTFISEPRKERLFTTGPQSSDAPKLKPDSKHGRDNLNVTKVNDTVQEKVGPDVVKDVGKVSPSDDVPARDNAYNEVGSPTVGVIIGILLTIISILVGGIAYVIYRTKRSGKGTPTHSLLSRKQPGESFGGNGMPPVGNVGDTIKESYLYTPYGMADGRNAPAGKVTVYVPMGRPEEGIYDEPLQKIYSGGFLSLNPKYGSDPVLSEDCTDEYAEPNGVASNSFNENIYSRAVETKMSAAALPPLPINHYARPLSPRPFVQKFSKRAQQPTLTLPPPPSQMASGGSSASRSPPKNGSHLFPSSSSTTSSPSSGNSAKNQKRKLTKNSSSSRSTHGSHERGQKKTVGGPAAFGSLGAQDLISRATSEQGQILFDFDKKFSDLMLLAKPSRSTSIDTVNVVLQEIDRSNLSFEEKLGEGQFGEIHLCRLRLDTPNIPEDLSTPLVAVKSLRVDSDETSRTDFEQEARILTSLSDPNLVRVLGVCFSVDPICMICEYTDKGDLCQFLQDHVAETSLSKSPGVPTLSYGCLIYLATQIASGMKYLESLNFVHRDLAARNCLVGHNKVVKISDYGMSRATYKNDYYRSPAGCLLPIRWMAWESVILGKFTTKSDVWSFGVTLWEILTFAREQPHESLSDERVINNLSRLYEAKGRRPSGVSLPTPFQCPREVKDLMNECWQRDDSKRPPFHEIHLFLQRKNLGYDPTCDLESCDDVTIANEDATSATDGDDYDDIDAENTGDDDMR